MVLAQTYFRSLRNEGLAGDIAAQLASLLSAFTTALTAAGTQGDVVLAIDNMTTGLESLRLGLVLADMAVDVGPILES